MMFSIIHDKFKLRELPLRCFCNRGSIYFAWVRHLVQHVVWEMLKYPLDLSWSTASLFLFHRLGVSGLTAHIFFSTTEGHSIDHIHTHFEFILSLSLTHRHQLLGTLIKVGEHCDEHNMKNKLARDCKVWKFLGTRRPHAEILRLERRKRA